MQLSGLPSHPANVNRLRGVEEVLNNYPDINVLTEVNGDWDQASAQQAMSNLLASYPKIDGVLSQDGMALGIAVRMLQGKKIKNLDGNNYFYPVSDYITADNFDEYYEKYQFQPDSYFIDEWLTEEELDAMMEGVYHYSGPCYWCDSIY